jgi:hypothetical protein
MPRTRRRGTGGRFDKGGGRSDGRFSLHPENPILESRMHATVPVRFGRGRLDSLGNKGLAAYLITSLRPKTRSWAKWVAAHLLHYDGFSLKLVRKQAFPPRPEGAQLTAGECAPTVVPLKWIVSFPIEHCPCICFFLWFGANADRGIQTSTSFVIYYVGTNAGTHSRARHNRSTQGFHCSMRKSNCRPARTI